MVVVVVVVGAGVGVVGVYKSVSNVMGLHVGCSPVVPSTLVAHSWNLKEFRSVVITNHNTSNLNSSKSNGSASTMTTTAVAGEPIPIMHPPSLTPAISIDGGNDARCMTHDHAMTGTHSPGRPPSTTDHANRPQRQRQRQ